MGKRKKVEREKKGEKDSAIFLGRRIEKPPSPRGIFLVYLAFAECIK